MIPPLSKQLKECYNWVKAKTGPKFFISLKFKFFKYLVENMENLWVAGKYNKS